MADVKKRKKKRLSKKAIIDILTSVEPASVLSARYLCHRSTVSSIQTGKIYPNIAPEIPRRNPAKSCQGCIHWETECDLGHIDPIEEGLSFASFCNSFNPIKKK